MIEISKVVNQEGKIDYITFVGEGEPTLSKDLGILINETKRLTDLPIAVITNGSLLSLETVREEIRKVDVIIPTFDAGNSKLFRFINRPNKEVHFNELVTGLKKLRQEFCNELWIEVMLLKGTNDSAETLEEIKGFLDIFHPNQVHISIPSRPPTESWVEIPDNESLNLGQLILQSTQTLPLNEVGIFDSRPFRTPTEAIFSITKRHPLQYNQALEIIHQFNIDNPEAYLNMIVTKLMIKILEYRDTRFIYRNEVCYSQIKTPP